MRSTESEIFCPGPFVISAVKTKFPSGTEVRSSRFDCQVDSWVQEASPSSVESTFIKILLLGLLQVPPTLKELTFADETNSFSLGSSIVKRKGGPGFLSAVWSLDPGFSFDWDQSDEASSLFPPHPASVNVASTKKDRVSLQFLLRRPPTGKLLSFRKDIIRRTCPHLKARFVPEPFAYLKAFKTFLRNLFTIFCRKPILPWRKNTP